MELSNEIITFLRLQYREVDKYLYNKKLLDLKNYKRHFYTNTYDHSVRVAAVAAILAKWLHTDVESVVRISLTHDMCFVNYYKKNDHKGWYLFYHPVEAAQNAEAEFGLTQREQRAIKAHMFPLSLHILWGKEAICLTLADKVVAIYEGTYGLGIFRKLLCAIARHSLDCRLGDYAA